MLHRTMKQITNKILVTVFVTLFMGFCPSFADDKVPEELPHQLLQWIERNTGLEYQYDGKLPTIVLTTNREMVDMAVNSTPEHQFSEEDKLQMQKGVEAFYLDRIDTVVLGENVDLSTFQGQSTLLHELVHYVQYKLGKDKSAACIQALEPEAYAAQNNFLMIHHQQPRFTRFTIKIRGLCPRDMW